MFAQLLNRQRCGLANKYNSRYGISIRGLRRLDNGDRPVRVFVQKETADEMAVIVKCENLEPGAEYFLYRLSAAEEKKPKPLSSFQAKQQAYAVHDAIARGSSRDLPLSEGGTRALTPYGVKPERQVSCAILGELRWPPVALLRILSP